MKEHRRFEFQAAEWLQDNGYSNIDVTRGVADWGADAFCEKDGKRFVCQVKMYGSSRTKISRKDVMELYGVMAYFDCQGALFIYNGHLTPDAVKAAGKLGIGLVYLDRSAGQEHTGSDEFETLWNKHVMPLEGKEITTISGVRYNIGRVTDADIHFVTTSGSHNSIKKDLIKWTFDKVTNSGPTRAVEIRDEFKTRFSSFVAAVFRYIPGYAVGPGRLIYQDSCNITSE